MSVARDGGSRLRRLARAAASAAQARQARARSAPGWPSSDRHPRPGRGRAGGRRGGLGQRRVVRPTRRAGGASTSYRPGAWGRSRWSGRAWWARSCPGRRRGERRHPARAAHAQPHLAHGPPQPGGDACAGALRRPSAPSTCATSCGGTTERAPHPGRRRGFAAVPSGGRPRGSSSAPTRRLLRHPGIAFRAAPGWRAHAGDPVPPLRRAGSCEWAEAPEPHAGPGQVRVAVQAPPASTRSTGSCWPARWPAASRSTGPATSGTTRPASSTRSARA